MANHLPTLDELRALNDRARNCGATSHMIDVAAEAHLIAIAEAAEKLEMAQTAYDIDNEDVSDLDREEPRFRNAVNAARAAGLFGEVG